MSLCSPEIREYLLLGGAAAQLSDALFFSQPGWLVFSVSASFQLRGFDGLRQQSTRGIKSNFDRAEPLSAAWHARASRGMNARSDIGYKRARVCRKCGEFILRRGAGIMNGGSRRTAALRRPGEKVASKRGETSFSSVGCSSVRCGGARRFLEDNASVGSADADLFHLSAV
jgi:hypothetical protein